MNEQIVWQWASGVKCFVSGVALSSLMGPAVSTISTFRLNGMRKKEFYLSLDYPLHHPLRELMDTTRQTSVSCCMA
jgi:hypothetical protein